MPVHCTATQGLQASEKGMRDVGFAWEWRDSRMADTSCILSKSIFDGKTNAVRKRGICNPRPRKFMNYRVIQFMNVEQSKSFVKDPPSCLPRSGDRDWCSLDDQHIAWILHTEWKSHSHLTNWNIASDSEICVTLGLLKNGLLFTALAAWLLWNYPSPRADIHIDYLAPLDNCTAL